MSARPWVLGYSSSHNGAVCLMHGEEIVVCVQEERLSGTKRARIRRLDESLAFQYCLDAAGLQSHQLDAVVGCYFAGDRIEGSLVADGNSRSELLWIPHHLGHAFGAYVTSGMTEAAVLVIDGQGGLERFQPATDRPAAVYATASTSFDYSEIMSVYRFSPHTFEPLQKHYGAWLIDGTTDSAHVTMPRFASLGGMYSAATIQIFGDAMDPGKVMGLAAYGSPNIPVEEFFSIHNDGHYIFSNAVCRRFQHAARWPSSRNDYEHLASSVQAALEIGVLDMARRTSALSGCDSLVYAGGVALNSVANEKLIRARLFRDLFVMPAAEDSGTAIGAAAYGLRHLDYRAGPRYSSRDSMGKRYTPADVALALDRTPHVERVTPRAGDLLDDVVDRLVSGQIVGWFQRGSELGPRALGQRSILADARHPDVKDTLNKRVKHREPFRPFAPAILQEEATAWFEIDGCDRVTPFMLRAPRFRPEVVDRVPGAVHHDGTGRLQTIGPDADPRYRALLLKFFARTGVPLLINTSFNVMGEPIVETPDDALWCLLYTNLDCCVLEDVIVRRSRAFRSVLDLVPHLAAETISFIVRPSGGPLRTELDGDTCTVELTCRRPWGLARTPVPLEWLPLLELFDGRKTGRHILTNLQEADSRIDDRYLARALRALRRCGAASFTASTSHSTTDIVHECHE